MKAWIWAGLALLPVVASAQSAAEIALAQRVLTQLQAPSITEDVEYCGFIGLDVAGRLTATQPTRGDATGCLSAFPRALQRVTASYHTHGAHSVAYYKEIPSGSDVRSDTRAGINGYVATPGGRLWLIRPSDRVLTQLCGIGCLPSDPRFVAGQLGPVAQSYSFAQLFQLLQ